MPDDMDLNQPPEGVDESVDLTAKYHLTFPEQSIESIGDALRLESESLGEAEFERQLTKDGTYVELLKRMIDSHTDQTEFMSRMLKRITDTSSVGDAFEYSGNPDIIGDKGFVLKNRSMSVNKNLKGAEVSGYQAKMLILATNHNVRKIPLYNSGFNITLRGPSLVEMNLIYNRLGEDMTTYGRMMGAVFFMYADDKIKSIIWEFIESLVIGSNLIKYDRGGRLRDNVSFLDYQQIVLSIGVLMYRNGYTFTHVCTNPACKTAHTALIDLSLLQLTDFSRIPHEQLATMAAGGDVDTDALEAYRKVLNVDEHFTVGRYRIYRVVPSMTSYLNNAEIFNSEMTAAIQGIDDAKIVDQYLRYNYNQMFAPWISRIEVLDESGVVSFKVAERNAIGLVLTELQNSDDGEAFSEQMTRYIQDSTITNIGHLATECPACGALPTGLTNGFVPFDAQNSFFTMLVMRLIQTS